MKKQVKKENEEGRLYKLLEALGMKAKISTGKQNTLNKGNNQHITYGSHHSKCD